MAKPDDAGRVIAGLLTYNPGPGIYSRLERAIQAMPENVRTQELPGLLKRYKDGVPGWELKAVDLDSVIGQRPAVSREELLQAVKERSPVYTHKEVVLTDGGPVIKDQPHYSLIDFDGKPLLDDIPVYQDAASSIGRGIKHGDPKYGDYSQGGKDYTEVLLLQPNAGERDFSNHWSGNGNDAVAHARYDIHGDAMRINELQSDLGIHNRKVREAIASHKGPPAQLPGESDSAYLDRVQEQGYVVQMSDEGEWTWVNDPNKQGIPFPLEDAWSDILIKRLALEAARKGHRAIEVASPRAIADKVGGNIENYEHFYGKVVPGAIERLGRKMGGLTGDVTASRQAVTKSVWDESEDLLNQYRRFNQGEPERIDAFNDLLDAASPAAQRDAAYRIYEMFNDGDPGYATAVTRDAMALAEQTNAARAVRERLLRQGIGPPKPPPDAPGRRYIMSDEMRRRLIEGGVGAAVATGIMSQDDLINRLNQ
jgi:hypothetical protein